MQMKLPKENDSLLFPILLRIQQEICQNHIADIYPGICQIDPVTFACHEAFSDIFIQDASIYFIDIFIESFLEVLPLTPQVIRRPRNMNSSIRASM